jgi:hypothetical protein
MHSFDYIYGLPSWENCIDLRQISRERDQRRLRDTMPARTPPSPFSMLIPSDPKRTLNSFRNKLLNERFALNLTNVSTWGDVR